MVPGSFDSLMAKLIVTGATRQQALARARRALQEFTIEGVASVLPFHRAVVNDPAFHGEEGLGVHTRWIETEMSTHFEAVDRPDTSENMTLLRTFIEIDGKRVRLGLPSNLALQHAGANPGAPAAPEPVAIAAPGDVPAPLSGSLVAWKKADGDTVAAGEIIAVMEAMKMETSVHAPYAGTLECLAKAGETVASGQLVGRIRAA
jgi:acetyl-CoA/propionyl-CoA carboxylase biotin carboxyl carrier protein